MSQHFETYEGPIEGFMYFNRILNTPHLDKVILMKQTKMKQTWIKQAFHQLVIINPVFLKCIYVQGV